MLHVGEVQLTGAPGIAGASAIGGQCGRRRRRGRGTSRSSRRQRHARWGRRPGCTGEPHIYCWKRRYECGRRLRAERGRRRRSVQTGLKPAGWREWQQSVIQHGFWRRPDCRCCQHQQSADHSRVQSQESLQRLAVHLRSDHGSRRPDHNAGAACVAGGSSAATTEFIESEQLIRILRAPLAECRVRRRPSLPSSHSNKIYCGGRGI